MDSFFTRFALSDAPAPRTARHLVFWLWAWVIQGLLYGFLYLESPNAFVLSFGEALIYLPTHIFLSYSIMYWVLPRFMYQGRYWTGLFLVALLILTTAFLSPVLSYFLITPWREFLGRYPKAINPFYSFLGGLRGSLTVSGFAVAIKLLKQWYMKKTEAERLEKEKLKAELELLKGNLHPHFMFNTLNSIYSMALKNAPQTPDAILKLSHLMRYMITECKQPAIDLTKEIQILTTYMELEKSRLGERLDQTWDVRGEVDNKKIAPLILLPFIENSFKHGAYAAVDQAWLSMEILVAGSELSFRLINGKSAGIDTQQLTTGTGLGNVRKRLALLYPESHELRIIEDDDTYIISLKLSLDRIVLPAA